MACRRQEPLRHLLPQRRDRIIAKVAPLLSMASDLYQHAVWREILDVSCGNNMCYTVASLRCR